MAAFLVGYSPVGITQKTKQNLQQSSSYFSSCHSVCKQKYSRCNRRSVLCASEKPKKDSSTPIQEQTRFENQRPMASQPDTLQLLRMYIQPTRWPERFKVVFMSFLSFIICNIDRVNISIAVLPMARTYGWDQTTVGLVQSSFFWGYVLTQIPGGYFAKRYGGKLVLGVGVVSWSLMTFLTPIAATASLPILLAARALLGVGEGVAMPSMNQMIATWVPASERGRSLSLIYSGMYMGSVLGLLLCPILIMSFGWPSVFYAFGSVGIVWWFLWQFAIGSSPDQCAGISDSEKEWIMAGMPSAKRSASSGAAQEAGTNEAEVVSESIPWLKFLTHPAMFAICTAHFCVTWGYFVLLTWLPTYFNTRLGFDLSSSSLFAVIPWICMFICANIGGNIADWLLKRKLTVTAVRKLMQTIGFMGPAVFLALVATTTNPALAVVYMSAALGLGSFSQSGVYSNHQDIGPPEYAGILLGISNTIAALPGIIGVALTGLILDTTGGNWNVVFGIAIGFYILGTFVYNIFGTGERVF